MDDTVAAVNGWSNTATSPTEPAKYLAVPAFDTVVVVVCAGQAPPRKPVPTYWYLVPKSCTTPALVPTDCPSRYSVWLLPAAVSTAWCHCPSVTTFVDASGVCTDGKKAWLPWIGAGKQSNSWTSVPLLMPYPAPSRHLPDWVPTMRPSAFTVHCWLVAPVQVQIWIFPVLAVRYPLTYRHFVTP